MVGHYLNVLIDTSLKPGSYFPRDGIKDIRTIRFPLHDICYEILARVLSGKRDISLIRKEILYEAIFYLDTDITARPSLDYEITGGRGTWESIAGEEVSHSGYLCYVLN